VLNRLIRDTGIGTTVAPQCLSEGLLFPYSDIILAYCLIYLNLYWRFFWRSYFGLTSPSIFEAGNWNFGRSTLHFGSMAVVQVEDSRIAFSFVIQLSPLSIVHFYDQPVLTPPDVHDTAENVQKQDYLMHVVFCP
jgi:hypothetical protein